MLTAKLGKLHQHSTYFSHSISKVTFAVCLDDKRLGGSDRFPAGTRIRVPTGVAAFPDPVFLPTPRSFAEKAYDIVHWTDFERGGHFAALEEPDLMLADLRTFIATVSEERS